MLPVDLPPLGGIGQFDEHAPVGTAGGGNVTGHLDGRIALVGGEADELAEDLPLGRGAPEQVSQTAQAGQQGLQRATKAVPPTDAEKVLGPRIQVNDGAVGFDNEDGGGETAENIGGLGRGA